MKILLATNFFKGSLSAVEAADVIRKAILSVNSDYKVVSVPIADGGDGSLEAIKNCTDTREITSEVCGPLGKKVYAKWLIVNSDKKTAVIEAAQANGLSLIKPEEYNALKTTTYGVGELIKLALDADCEEIILSIGGSATNDGGAGILQALGIKLLDESGNEVLPGGKALENLEKIDISDIDKRLSNVKITVACDVDNPLCGPNGASYVYGPQKGASEQDVRLLDQNLAKLAALVKNTFGIDYKDFPGTGAAGGISFALKSFFNAELVPGFNLIAKLSCLEEKMKTADLVITTEGRLDFQSLCGKAPYQFARLAKKYNIPVLVFAGSVERNLDLQKAGIKAAFSIVNGPLELQDAMENAEYLLGNLSKQIFNTINISVSALR